MGVRRQRWKTRATQASAEIPRLVPLPGGRFAAVVQQQLHDGDDGGGRAAAPYDRRHVGGGAAAAAAAAAAAMLRHALAAAAAIGGAGRATAASRVADNHSRQERQQRVAHTAAPHGFFQLCRVPDGLWLLAAR